MLIELAFQRNIDFDKSLFIGDSSVDKIASEAVNCRFINILDLWNTLFLELVSKTLKYYLIA